MNAYKHYLEYALLRGIAFIARVLPYRAALCFAWLLGWIGHYLVRFRRKEAHRRIREVFGDRFSGTEVRRIAWVSWRNLCLNAIEILRMHLIDDQYVKEFCESSEVQRIHDTIRRDRGAVLAVPHIGNWDLAGVAAHRLGVPFFFIARRQKNALIDAYLNRMRGVTGIDTLLSDDRAMLRQVVKRLKAGMVFAILPDVRSRTPALTVPFMNGEANVAAGVALFARLADVPIIPAFQWRRGWTRHVWRVGHPVFPDQSLTKEADYQRMMETVFRFFDQAISEHPENYFWYNKRWVLEPLAGSKADAP